VKKKPFVSLVGFVLVLFLHVSYSVWESKRIAERWLEIPGTDYFTIYFERSDYLIGASYALAIGFSIYALLRFVETRKQGFTGLVGGVTLTGILYVGGCFLLGCCGSPMLAVYLTLFGSSFLEFAKPLTFILTFASIVVGYIWLERNSVSKVDCCEGDEDCKRT